MKKYAVTLRTSNEDNGQFAVIPVDIEDGRPCVLYLTVNDGHESRTLYSMSLPANPLPEPEVCDCCGQELP